MNMNPSSTPVKKLFPQTSQTPKTPPKSNMSEAESKRIVEKAFRELLNVWHKPRKDGSLYKGKEFLQAKGVIKKLYPTLPESDF